MNKNQLVSKEDLKRWAKAIHEHELSRYLDFLAQRFDLECAECGHFFSSKERREFFKIQFYRKHLQLRDFIPGCPSCKSERIYLWA